MAGTFPNIREHGICVDEKKQRAKCNYCGKEVCSFSRLKCHLGGVGKDVTHCDYVTVDIRAAFRSMLMKNKSAAKRVGRSLEGSSTKDVSLENENEVVVETDEQVLKVGKCISRHFYENYIDFSVVDSPSFKEMMSVGCGEMQSKIPNCDDLKGWMLQEALKEVQDHVKKVKHSWAITGCSILLDAWIDQNGRDLVSFVADCPMCPVYLKSVDVTDIKSDANALMSLVDGVVEEVGEHNVVQIIACSASGWVGEFFAGNKKKGLWSVSLSHCFELMLERVGKLYAFREIMDKVNKIPEFFNHNPSTLKLLRDLNSGVNMTFLSSEFEFVTPYLFIEGVFNAKKDLTIMFGSSGWNKEEGITMSKFMSDSSFWESVESVVKCTSPLLHGLFMLSNVKNQHVGFIYEIMDGIKESIAKKFDHKELCYKPVWDVIDEVWKKHLYSPLHAAGYFLNPTAFYSTDFNLDQEVSTDLACSLVHIIRERDIQVKIATQIDLYRLGKECFEEASRADQISGICPAEWWGAKASEHPELQRFSIKVLSQTCEGASRYKLKRSLAEKLLRTERMSYCTENQYLEDLAFVHYNLHLQNFKANSSKEQ